MFPLRWAFSSVAIAIVSVVAHACVASDATAQPRAPAPQLRIHRVAPRDTLRVIATRYRVAGGVAELARLNAIRNPDAFSARGILVPDNAPFTDALPAYVPPPRVASVLQACALHRSAPPASATVAGCDRAACTTLRDGSRVCGCISPNDGARDVELRVLDRRGRVRERRPFESFLGEVEGFDVREGDVDGDGASDLVIATLSAVSNGMGVTLWSVSISRRDGRGRVRFDVQEYGEGTFVARAEGLPGCDVLATSWEEHIDERRGAGEYLVGRTHRWRNGRLDPTGEIRVRRLLDSFAAERDASCATARFAASACAEPAAWLSSASAEQLAGDPVTDGTATLVVSGRIAAVHREAVGDGGALAFDLRTSSPAGGVTRVRYRAALALDAPIGDTWTRIGDARTRVLLPPAYQPADARATFVSRDATLEQRTSEMGDPTGVLWIAR